jgi:hypothetical protein
MNKVRVRLVILAAAMMLCLLAQHPQQADAAVCPSLSCTAFEAGCTQRHCTVLSSTLIGTCSQGASIHGEYLVRCSCEESICYL